LFFGLVPVAVERPGRDDNEFDRSTGKRVMRCCRDGRLAEEIEGERFLR